MFAVCISANQRLAIGGFPQRAEFLRMLAAAIPPRSAPLSERIWRAGTWKHGTPCHAAFHWAMSTKAVILYRSRTPYSAHQDGVAGLPTITHGLYSVLIRRGCSRRYPLARIISRQKGDNDELKGHGASRGPVGRGCSLNEAHVAFGINGQDSTELSRDIISFFLLFLTETRNQRTLCGGALRYGHGSNEAKAG